MKSNLSLLNLDTVNGVYDFYCGDVESVFLMILRRYLHTVTIMNTGENLFAYARSCYKEYYKRFEFTPSATYDVKIMV